MGNYTIYRLRPASSISVDEIRNHYLWFARPYTFKDIDDSNIVSFIEKNESIKSSFERIFNDYKEVAKQVSCAGICCFTETLPAKRKWKHFPNKVLNGLCIEYDKYLLEQFFKNTRGIVDCFKKIDYQEEPILFQSYSKPNDIVWKVFDDSILYKSMRAIEKDVRLMDELFLKMFTRLNIKFVNQKEVRIILGGGNIPDKSDNIQGYKVVIPKEAIKKVYFHSKMPKKIIKEIISIPNIITQMI